MRMSTRMMMNKELVTVNNKKAPSQGSSVFFVDGGLINNQTKGAIKIAYSSIKEFYSDNIILNVDSIIRMVKESIDNINVSIEDHMFLKQWQTRKTLETTFNVEAFTVLQVLYIIQKQKLLEKRNKIIIAFDNKAVYNALSGITKTNKCKYNSFIRDAIRVLKALNNRYPLLDKRLVLCYTNGKDIKTVLGH